MEASHAHEKGLAITALFNAECRRRGNSLSLRVRGENSEGVLFILDHGVWGDQSFVIETDIADVFYKMTLVDRVPNPASKAKKEQILAMMKETLARENLGEEILTRMEETLVRVEELKEAATASK